MTTALFYNLRNDLGLNPISVEDGEELVSDKNPDVTYILPSGEANGYHLDSAEEDFIIETLSDRGEHPDMYLSVSETEIEELDKHLKRKIDELDTSDYYKKIY